MRPRLNLTERASVRPIKCQREELVLGIDEENNGAGAVILLIEHDDSDAFLFRRAVAKIGFSGEVRVIGSATEGRAYMENTLEPSSTDGGEHFKRPILIFSDFRLAGHTATKFLLWLHQHPKFSDIPVFIYSGTASGFSVERLAFLGAIGYIPKTPDVEVLAAALEPFLPQSEVRHRAALEAMSRS